MIITVPANFSKGQTQRAGASAAPASFILHEKGRRHHWEGSSALSIKSFYHGEAFYNVGNGCYAVNDDSYLVLNHGQSYSITIDAAQPLESFCIFFAEGLAEEVFRSLVAKFENLLDEPQPPRMEPVHFFERTYPHDEMLTPALSYLRAALPRRPNDRGWLTEKLYLILHRLLRVHQQTRKEVETLPSLRPATREELYRRLHRAKDYAAALCDRPLTLEEMARVACLSPNHFLRTFKQAFAQTPHQFLIQLRLERAKHLLVQTGLSVTEIGATVGFESLGSFSWLFARRVGLSPEAYRRQSMQKAALRER
jgi:AraC-like DNA-binding protein